MSQPVTPTFTGTVLEHSCQEYVIFYAIRPDAPGSSLGLVYAVGTYEDGIIPQGARVRYTARPTIMAGGVLSGRTFITEWWLEFVDPTHL